MYSTYFEEDDILRNSIAGYGLQSIEIKSDLLIAY